jgi:hypothetical protein
MNKQSRNVFCRLLLGLFATSPSSHAYPAQGQDPQPVPVQNLRLILQLELSQTERRSMKPATDDGYACLFAGGPILHFVRPVSVGLYKPTQSDLDGDGKPEIISGFQFLNKGELFPHSDDRDFLAVYIADEEGALRKRFHKSFAPSDRGHFVDLQVADLTGDGKREICLRYNYANAGAIRWDWKEVLYIISGPPAFRTLLELPVSEGWGDVKGAGHARRSEIKFRDLNSDGIREILVHTYEAKDDTGPMNRVTERAVVYRLLRGRYARVSSRRAPAVKARRQESSHERSRGT